MGKGYIQHRKITQKSLRKRKRKKIAQKSERLITANSEPWRLFKSSFSCCSYPYSATFLKILSGFKSCCSEGDAWVHPGLECGSTSPPHPLQTSVKDSKVQSIEGDPYLTAVQSANAGICNQCNCLARVFSTALIIKEDEEAIGQFCPRYTLLLQRGSTI